MVTGSSGARMGGLRRDGDVLSGGRLEFEFVSSGGMLNVSSGGTADHITVSSGGTANVLGTITSDVSVFSGGVEYVSSGGVVTGASGAATGFPADGECTLGGQVGVLFRVERWHAERVGRRDGVPLYRLEWRHARMCSARSPGDVSVVTGGVENVSSGGVITGASGAATGFPAGP